MAHDYEPVLDPFEVVVPAGHRSNKSRRLLVVAGGLAAGMLLVLGALSYGGEGSAARPPSMAEKSSEDTNVFENKFSTPSTGIFTGHRHGLKGGKFTFGKGTYFNVFNPAPNHEECGPGHHFEGGNCVECPAGYFCPGTNVLKKCVENTMSPPGASAEAECLCVAGLYGKYDTSCKKCPSGSFCPGTGTKEVGTEPVTCPLNSDSEEGQPVCRCIPTYVGVDFQDCKVCPANSFCEGGSHSSPCPEHTVSAEGSRACSCAPGYYGMDGDVCTKCPGGSYCKGGAAQDPCPPGATSRAGSKGVDECVCKAGYSGKDGVSCEKCPEGSYCPGLEKKAACPEHSTSASGSDEDSDCQCSPGWVGSDATLCHRCPVRHWCPGGTTLNSCPGHATSLEGSDQVSDCFCEQGYLGTDPLTCQPCPADSYCSGGSAVDACPPHTSAPPASYKKNQCVCAAGFYGPDWASCETCPETSVCPGGGKHVPCPANSRAPKGSTQVDQCACDAGYYGQGGGVCMPCPQNSFCTGGGAVERCGPAMMAPVGAKRSGDCVCTSDGKYNLMSPRSPVSGAKACEKDSCMSGKSVCEFQEICERDKMCRGFTFKGDGSSRLGSGCILKGMSSCLSVMHGEGSEVWTRNNQPPDSISEMRALGIPLPTCSPSGQKVRFWQHCWPSPHDGWYSDLPVGDYSRISSGSCDNDGAVCEVQSCGLRAGDMSSVTIPSGMRVIIYDQPNFGGNSLVLNGPMDPNPNCLAHKSGSRRGNWNDVVASVRVQNT